MKNQKKRGAPPKPEDQKRIQVKVSILQSEKEIYTPKFIRSLIELHKTQRDIVIVRSKDIVPAPVINIGHEGIEQQISEKALENYRKSRNKDQFILRLKNLTT